MIIRKAMDIPELFPIRKTSKQKEAFRSTVLMYIRSLGYEPHVEKGYLGSKNIVFGNQEGAKYLITAHYDTCAGMLVPNMVTPCNLPLFLMYQLFVSVLYLAPVFLLSFLVGYLTKSFWLEYWVRLLLLFGTVFLMLAGPANHTNANDNTSGVVTVLEIARSLPKNLRGEVCFVLFDLEELGMIGSASYKKAHTDTVRNQLVLNLDCVGDGNLLYFLPTSNLKKKNNTELLRPVREICGIYGQKSINLKTGISVYPSDQTQFPFGFGICALRESKFGPYLGRIHTARDTILDETNVNILRAALISMIGSTAVVKERKNKNENV